MVCPAPLRCLQLGRQDPHPAGSLPLQNPPFLKLPWDEGSHRVWGGCPQLCAVAGRDGQCHTHQLCRVPEPGAQAAELLGRLPGRSQGPAGQREEAVAGLASPTDRAVVPRAQQPLAAGRGARLHPGPSAHLGRERTAGVTLDTPR